MLEPIQDNLDVDIELANVGNHVPQAEKNNRFLGERFRACYHNLPFKAIPWTMIKFMCLNQTHNTNIFPAKNGISNYLSPFIIIRELLTTTRHVRWHLEHMCKDTM
jgi:hypothetical protein